LLPEIRHELTDLLRGLTLDEWNAPTACGDWTVGDVASHLLGVELSNVARWRDGVAESRTVGNDIGEWLAELNEQWVAAARRLSPQLITDLIDMAAGWFEEHVATLELDALEARVSWAGEEPAPVWMDVAREYTERWVHQQHIREAVDRPGLMEPRYLTAVLATFVHSVPVALSEHGAPEGTGVELRMLGEGGNQTTVSARAQTRSWTSG